VHGRTEGAGGGGTRAHAPVTERCSVPQGLLLGAAAAAAGTPALLLQVFSEPLLPGALALGFAGGAAVVGARSGGYLAACHHSHGCALGCHACERGKEQPAGAVSSLPLGSRVGAKSISTPNGTVARLSTRTRTPYATAVDKRLVRSCRYSLLPVLGYGL
jgi:hypothetical protein